MGSVSIGATGFVVIALVVFAAWRIVCWLRGGRNAVREGVVVALFIYLVGVACVTFFPMDIILSDWHGRSNFVPFASIIDLIRHETRAVALLNIGGNVAMFAPMGLLLPLLFSRLRSLGSLAWRVAVISSGIELLQLPTRIRATDVDDIILNVVGAVLGYALFRLVTTVARSRPHLASFLDRVEADKRREPLFVGLIPVVATVLLTVALLIVPEVLAHTLDEEEIRTDAVSGVVGASVLARADAGDWVFLLAGKTDDTPEVFWCVEYKRVLLGRYTKMMGPTEAQEGVGSCYTTRYTVWNTRVARGPTVYVLGRNDSGASTLVVSSKELTTSFEASIGEYFVVALPAASGLLPYADATFAFLDPAGRDVTPLFENQNE